MTLDLQATLRLTLDPGEILRAQGIEPDGWQTEFLLCPSKRILLNCCRGAGKSRTTSALAVHTALFQPKSLVLLISRTQRQALELYRYCKQGMRSVGWPVKPVKDTETQLELENGSRIVSLPGKEGSIRSYQSVTLLIIDEAAKVGDDLFASVSPMTAICDGKQVMLSTPFGMRGFFWREWTDERSNWTRFRVPWQRCPRHTRATIEEECRKFGEMWVEQEYECSFTSLEGLVYPDFEQCLWDTWPLPKGRPVGGIDWGWHNPFAALWGVLDSDGILWIGWERYERHCPLAEHLRHIENQAKRQAICPPAKRVEWVADPSGPEWISQCRQAGWHCLKGPNEIRMGIMAVTERIRTGKLRVYRPSCPNLAAESQLYRYPTAAEKQAGAGENPVDEHNHALGALRYLIARLDRHLIGKARRKGGVQLESAAEAGEAAPEIEETQESLYGARAKKPEQKPWFRIDNDALWSPL